MRLAACCCCKVDTTQGDQLNLHLCSHSLLLQGGAKPQDQAAAQAGAPQMPQMPYGMGAYGYGAMPQVGGWKYPVVRKGWTACLQKTLASMRVHANRAARAATAIRHSALNTAPSALPLTSAVPLHGQPLWRLPLRCWLCRLCPARRPHLPAPGEQRGSRCMCCVPRRHPAERMADCTAAVRMPRLKAPSVRLCFACTSTSLAANPCANRLPARRTASRATAASRATDCMRTRAPPQVGLSGHACALLGDG